MQLTLYIEASSYLHGKADPWEDLDRPGSWETVLLESVLKDVGKLRMIVHLLKLNFMDIADRRSNPMMTFSSQGLIACGRDEVGPQQRGRWIPRRLLI